MNLWIEQGWIPSALFLIFFTIVFLLIELVVVFVLNRMEHRYWTFVVDVLIGGRVHHRWGMKMVMLMGVGMIIGGVLWATGFIQLLLNLSGDLKWIAGGLPILMLMIYFISVRKNAKLNIEKRI